MSHITETKTQESRHRRGRRRPKPQAPPTWRPQPSGLTRDELRQIVIDTLG